MPTEEGNSNIRVEITGAAEFHCFRLVLNPRMSECKACGGSGFSPTGGRGIPCETCQGHARVPVEGTGIEIMLHARSLVDLIHKCSVALCEWQVQTSQYLIDRIHAQTAAAPADPYRDDAFAERPCDRCGEVYRGPSVYCSFGCAVADGADSIPGGV